jgi:membrane protease YdiL (CAAX protease family)
MYDAYRDAGPSHSTNYNVAENYIAFLNPLNLIDPFSVGFVGIGAIAGRNSKNRTRMGPRSPVLGAFFYGFVGLGEEGLFRGFLFPGFSDLFDSYVAGAVTSSILFSVSHLTNKQAFYHSATGLSFLFLAGMVFCWQTHYNHFDLRHSIFAHAWYDFLVDYGYQTTNPLQSNAPTGYGLRFGFDLR